MAGTSKTRGSAETRSSHWAGVALLAFMAAISLAVAVDLDRLAPVLRYERQALAQGEWWRLVTCLFVHHSPIHVIYNSIGLGITAAIVFDVARARNIAVLLLTSTLVVSAFIYWFSPELRTYVGFSATTHGILSGAGLLMSFTRDHRRFGLLILAFLAVKIAYEHTFGSPGGTEALVGGAVAIEAHAYGVAGGLIGAVVLQSWDRLSRRAARSQPGAARRSR